MRSGRKKKQGCVLTAQGWTSGSGMTARDGEVKKDENMHGHDKDAGAERYW